MNAAVAHHDENIALFELDTRGIDLFPLNIQLGLFVVVLLPVAQQDEHGVVILHDLGDAAAKAHDGERGIRHLPHGADRKRRGHRMHAFFDRQTFADHRREHFARQRRQNARLDAASQSVGQNDDRRAVFLFNDVDMVAAKLLADVVCASVADIGAKIIHSGSTPSAATARSSSPRRSRPKATRSAARCASACRRRGRPSPPSGGRSPLFGDGTVPRPSRRA